MIGALVTLLSLDMTRKLVAAGVIARTLTIVEATATTPIVLTTDAPHKLTRPIHAVVSGVSGIPEANGLYVLTPSGDSQFVVSTYSNQGAPVFPVGAGAYTGGGIAQTAFPDGGILLGRRNIAMQTSVATPRIVFVPLGSPMWQIAPYGGVIPPIPSFPRQRADQTAEQLTMKQSRQIGTERFRFEVHVTACAAPSDPDFGDFDVTQALYHQLYQTVFTLINDSCFLGGDWVSQHDGAASLVTRGQKWVGIVEISQPALDTELQFVPTSTGSTIVVNFADGASADQTVIQIPGAP